MPTAIDSLINKFKGTLLEEKAMRAIAKKDALGIFFSLIGGNEYHFPFFYNNYFGFKELGILEEGFFESYISTRLNNSNIPLQDLIWLANELDRKKIMSLGDPLPKEEPFKLFRGVAGNGKRRRIRGLSWTGLIDIAKWFAFRFDELQDPAVFQITVKKEDILFYTNAREEDEYIVLLPESVKPKRVKL